MGGCDPFSEFVPSLFRFGVMYHQFFIKSQPKQAEPTFFPYFPSKFPWHSHESHLHRLIPHFVQIRIQKFRCKAVGTDVFSGFLWGEPFAAVHFVVDMQCLCGFPKGQHYPPKRSTLSTQKANTFHPKGQHFPPKRSTLPT